MRCEIKIIMFPSDRSLRKKEPRNPIASIDYTWGFCVDFEQRDGLYQLVYGRAKIEEADNETS